MFKRVMLAALVAVVVSGCAMPQPNPNWVPPPLPPLTWDGTVQRPAAQQQPRQTTTYCNTVAPGQVICQSQ